MVFGMGGMQGASRLVVAKQDKERDGNPRDDPLDSVKSTFG